MIDHYRNICLDVLATTLSEGGTEAMVGNSLRIVKALRNEYVISSAEPETFVTIHPSIEDMVPEMQQHVIEDRIERAIVAVQENRPAEPEVVQLANGEVAETPPTAPDVPANQACIKCGVSKPVTDFKRTPYGWTKTCRPCVGKSVSEAHARNKAKRNGGGTPAQIKAGRPGTPAVSPEPRLKTEAPKPADERLVEAKKAYVDYLAAGNPPNNIIEGNLIERFGLNRTQVLGIRDELMEAKRGMKTTKCSECQQPFEQPGSSNQGFCEDCKAARREARRTPLKAS